MSKSLSILGNLRYKHNFTFKSKYQIHNKGKDGFIHPIKVTINPLFASKFLLRVKPNKAKY